ncbi:MAG: PGF-pre-PGF domain-containing protein [Halobacteriota archaeon]
MKEKREKWKGLMLLSLFVLLATTALLAGTVTAVQGAEVGGDAIVENVTRYAPRSSAPDAEFDVTLKISFSGELPSFAAIIETIPEGFSFVSTTQPTDKYVVSGQIVAFAVIDDTVIKYTVRAPSLGEGTFTGKWEDYRSDKKEGKIAGNLVIVGVGGAGAPEEDVTPTPTPTPVVPTVTKASRVVPVMEAEKEAAMVFEDMDVSMITLKSDKNVNDVTVEVERIERTPDIPEPSGVAYTYLEITEENAGGAKIEGRVEFKVIKSWLADNNIDEATVTLNRYDENEGWKALPTTKVGEDDEGFVFFEAQTSGFSTFAVTGEKKEEEEVETAAATPTPAIAASTPTPGPTIPSASESEVPGFGANPPALYLILVVFFALVAVALIAGYVFGKRGKRGDVK